MKNKPKIAYLYARFSDKKQEGNSSIRTQTEAAREWCGRNGATLDESTYRDMGVSGFTGEHRTNPDRHGLALCLRAIQDGKIPKASFLLLYNLDRLTREHIRPAYNLFNQILEAGVNIVQLRPERIFRHDAQGNEAMLDILTAVLELSRANSESEVKRNRITANWNQVREDARKGATVHLPGKIPFWITKTEDGYALNDNVEAVRLLYRLTTDGMGVIQARWKVKEKFNLNLSRPYARTLIKSRVVLGEWQPKDQAKKPIGEPIKEFFPAAITEDEYLAAQGSVATRLRPKKIRDQRRIYLFNSFMEDVNGDGFTVQITSGGRKKLKFIPNSYLDGETECVSFPVEPFEEAVRECLYEVNPKDVMTTDKSNDELLKLTGRKEELNTKIGEAEIELDEGNIPSLARKLRQWEGERTELDERMAVLRQKVKTPQTEAWVEMKKLIDLKDDETRLKFRSVVCRLVEKMVCVFVGWKSWRCAWVQIHFRDSHATRVIQVRYRSAANTFGGVREPLLLWDTWKEPADVKAEDLGEFVQKQLVELCTTYK